MTNRVRKILESRAVEELLREELRLPGLKNYCRLDGSVVRMSVWWDHLPMEAVFDAADLSLVRACGVFWTANPAKAPLADDGSPLKFYVQAKHKIGDRWTTIMFHRLILGLSDRKIEGHHKDNDGLNNRRGNLEAIRHIDNVRAAGSVGGERFKSKQGGLEKDWAEYDRMLAARERIRTPYRRERKIAREIRDRYGISRGQMFRVRVGEIPLGKVWRQVGLVDYGLPLALGGRSTVARTEYVEACRAAGIQTLGEMQAQFPREGKWGAAKSGMLIAPVKVATAVAG